MSLFRATLLGRPSIRTLRTPHHHLGQTSIGRKQEEAAPVKKPQSTASISASSAVDTSSPRPCTRTRKGDPTAKSPKSSGMFGGEFGLHLNRWIGFEGEFAVMPTRPATTSQTLAISARSYGHLLYRAASSESVGQLHVPTLPSRRVRRFDIHRG